MAHLNPLSPKKFKLIVFPNSCGALGGALAVRVGSRFVHIKMPGREEAVKIERIKLIHPSKWTAFNLADAAQAHLDSLPCPTQPSNNHAT